ncbi:helix-turn-helix transcriptional regulator [Janthinobacterium sp. FW305-129]|nr:helix-turn-helix transcriptional regulator [Janthinobacterium sp. FW305-129]
MPVPTTRHLLLAPYSGALPAAICFRSAAMPAAGIYPSHSHSWGEFVYALSGVVEVLVAGKHYLVPPQYGIWLPPRVPHTGQNRHPACHSSLYVDEALCGELPAAPCALAVTPFVRAMHEHLRSHPPGMPQTIHEERLLQVLLDQLARAAPVGSYLPSSDDPMLGKVLAMLDSNPGDDRPLAALAQAVNTTERTLMRRCQRDLGMSFAQWRARLRVIKAMAMLETGQTVESIAFDLAYASSSAFITMFRKVTGETPDEYRRRSA